MSSNAQSVSSQISPTGIWPVEYNKYHVTNNVLKQYITSVLPRTTPVYDFGCGMGTYMKYLISHGYKCTGYEGTYQKNNLPIKQQDITIELPPPETKGSVLCLEVMEHIPSNLENITLDNINNHCDTYLILSWAIPDQPGIGHINCRSEQYTVTTLSRYGFIYQKNDTQVIRNKINKSNKQLWFTKSLHIFKRC